MSKKSRTQELRSLDRTAGQPHDPEHGQKFARQQQDFWADFVDDDTPTDLVDIFSLRPDPMQPRRALPRDVLREWSHDTTPDGMARMFGHWIEVSLQDGAQIASIILGSDIELVEGENGTTPFAQDALGSLAQLAGDIRVNGLTNPITISRDNIIETGERRWLAYHLLRLIDEDGDWLNIPARIVDMRSVWRQASENSARDDLNAIGKARQLALLLMDLHGVDQFQPFDAFEREQDFYAQVADGNEWRVPRGKGEQLLNAMGLKDGGQIRQYRGLLRVDANVWSRADDESWTEFEIREYAKKMSHTVTPVTVSKSKAGLIERLTSPASKLLARARANRLKPKERAQAASDMRTAAEQLLAMAEEIEAGED